MIVEKRIEILPSDLTPLDAHLSVKIDNDEVYCSTPVTSAGWGILLSKGMPKEKKFRLIRLNKLVSDKFANHLDDSAIQNDSGGFNYLHQDLRVTYPWMLSQRKGWNETHYMSFWMMHLSRLSAKASREFYDNIQSGDILDRDVFANDHASRHDRWNEYLKMKDYLLYVKSTDIEPNNKVTSMIAFPDHNKSLGSSIELLTGMELDIPVYKMQLNTSYFGNDQENFLSGIAWRKMVELDIHPQFEKTTNPDNTMPFILRRASLDDINFVY